MKKIILISILLLIISCGQQQDTIKIGFSGPLTGDVSVWGIPAHNAIKLAVAKVNDQGGINGIPVELISEDDKCEGKEAVTAVNKLISVDKVKAVFTLCSSTTVPTYPISHQNKIIHFSFAASTPDLTLNTPYFYRTFSSDALQGKVAAKLVAEQYSKVGIIYVNDEYGNGFKNVFAETLENNGIKVSALEAYTPGDIDFRTQISKVKQSSPDLIYLITFPKEGSLLIKQIRETGLETPMMASEGVFDPKILEVAGEAAEGLAFTYPKSQEGQPAYERFLVDYKATYGSKPNIFSPEAYDGMNLIAKAMRECGLTGDEMKQCLDNMDPYSGASGQIIFDQYGDPQKEYDLMIVRNGEFVKV